VLAAFFADIPSATSLRAFYLGLFIDFPSFLHRRRSSVNFRGKTFLPEKYVLKINKLPEFYMILAGIINKILEFYMIVALKMPEITQ